MKKLKRDIFHILNNQCGVALMMIMSAIVILMAVYGEFTFDSKISRLKATNILDRSQAKLLAESGMQLAMARLRLYKEAYNKVQGNKDVKNAVPAQLLNQLWEVPFIFPVPVTQNAPRSFRDTVEKFQTDTLLEGEMKVNVQNISNRLNLNLIRMDMAKLDPDEVCTDCSSALNMSETAINSDVSVSQALYFLLKKKVDERKEVNEMFEDRYGNINYQEMISNLKYFISDYGYSTLGQDPFSGEAEATFQRIPLTPKYGPLASASELYAVPGWNDELVELIQNEFSVYPNAQIDLNKLTANMLRILIPSINEDEIRDFFAWRDDPEDPKFINTIEDFGKYIVDQARVLSSEQFKERMEQFQARGITFGSNPNLFKIVSEGSYNRSVYTLVAYVVLPTETKPPAKKKKEEEEKKVDEEKKKEKKENQTTQLLEPRIIEIQIN